LAIFSLMIGRLKNLIKLVLQSSQPVA
jgi:hypothetical protein